MSRVTHHYTLHETGPMRRRAMRHALTYPTYGYPMPITLTGPLKKLLEQGSKGELPPNSPLAVHDHRLYLEADQLQVRQTPDGCAVLFLRHGTALAELPIHGPIDFSRGDVLCVNGITVRMQLVEEPPPRHAFPRDCAGAQHATDDDTPAQRTWWQRLCDAIVRPDPYDKVAP